MLQPLAWSPCEPPTVLLPVRQPFRGTLHLGQGHSLQIGSASVRNFASTTRHGAPRTCLFDSQGCISSLGIEDGADYPNGDSCQIAVASDNTRPINVIAFQTESQYDELVVNGVAYSGSDGPASVVPTEDIFWASDPWLPGR